MNPFSIFNIKEIFLGNEMRKNVKSLNKKDGTNECRYENERKAFFDRKSNIRKLNFKFLNYIKFFHQNSPSKKREKIQNFYHVTKSF
jgi:hypothetical protein